MAKTPSTLRSLILRSVSEGGFEVWVGSNSEDTVCAELRAWRIARPAEPCSRHPHRAPPHAPLLPRGTHRRWVAVCSNATSPTTCSPGRPPAGSASMPRSTSRPVTVLGSNASCAGYPPKVGGARPPFALERLEAAEYGESGDERIVYRLPHPAPDGATALSLTPVEFLERLALLIHPPRIHRHRYHGVLAPGVPTEGGSQAQVSGHRARA